MSMSSSYGKNMTHLKQQAVFNFDLWDFAIQMIMQDLQNLDKRRTRYIQISGHLCLLDRFLGNILRGKKASNDERQTGRLAYQFPSRNWWARPVIERDGDARHLVSPAKHVSPQLTTETDNMVLRRTLLLHKSLVTCPLAILVEFFADHL